MSGIIFNPMNLEDMIQLMDTYHDHPNVFFGKNTEGESVAISINEYNIVVVTIQKNGWIRRNTY